MTNARHDENGQRANGHELEPYVPPQIRRIQLSVDEALMGLCKTESATGPLGGLCDVSCQTGGS